MELWEFALMQTQKYDVLLPRARKSRAREHLRGDGKKKYGHSPVERSKAEDKIHGWKYLRQNKGARYLSAGSSRYPAQFYSVREGGVPGGTKGARTKQRNVTFDVSPETAEMAAHCLDYKLIWRSIPRRATSCARPCTR